MSNRHKFNLELSDKDINYGIIETLKEEDMDQNKVGLFIQERRKHHSMTQSDLAKALHVSDQAVSKWERGLNYPDINFSQVISRDLDNLTTRFYRG